MGTIRVTATVSFDYDTQDGLVTNEDEGHADMIDMLGNGDLSVSQYTITAVTVGEEQSA